MNVLSCGLLWVKSIKHLGNFGRYFSPRDIPKNPRSMYARVPHTIGAIFSINIIIVPYHRDSPANTRNSAVLLSALPIMAPVILDITKASSNICSRVRPGKEGHGLGCSFKVAA